MSETSIRIERATERDVPLILELIQGLAVYEKLAHEVTATEAGLRETVFRSSYKNLQEYLEGFRYTVAVLQDPEALERATVELCEDCQAEGVRYLEIRFAPQLHVRAGFEVNDVVRAVDRGIRKATAAFNARPEVASGREPRFAAGTINRLVEDKLKAFAERGRSFSRGPAAGNGENKDVS